MKGNENINLLFQNVHNLKYLMSIIKIEMKFIIICYLYIYKVYKVNN